MQPGAEICFEEWLLGLLCQTSLCTEGQFPCHHYYRQTTELRALKHVDFATFMPFLRTFGTRYVTFLILKTQVHGVFGSTQGTAETRTFLKQWYRQHMLLCFAHFRDTCHLGVSRQRQISCFSCCHCYISTAFLPVLQAQRCRTGHVICIYRLVSTE